MNKAEKALRRKLVTEALTTEKGIDAVIELLEAHLANDDINDDDAAEREEEAVRELVLVLGYGVEEG